MTQKKVEHPGKFLRRRFDNIGWHSLSLREISEKIGCTRPTLSNLLLGKRNIGSKLAIRIAKATRTKAETWMDLQTRWDLDQARKKGAKHGDTEKGS